MPLFRYRALTQAGEVVTGSLNAPDFTEVTVRIEYLGLIPVETTVSEAEPALRQAISFAAFSKPRAEDVTIFTGDLSLLLRTGARINEALELLASDTDIGRLRPTIAAITSSILSGESFGDAIARHPQVFPPLYVALARVGETSGALPTILDSLAAERQRAEAMRRRLLDALRYPAFLLLAATAVLTFFLLFVLPQFASVFRDFNAKLDPVLLTFLSLSDFLRSHGEELLAGILGVVVAAWLLWRRREVRERIMQSASRLPIIKPAMQYYRATLFCRNLSLLLSSGVTLSSSLRILVEIMASTGVVTKWSDVVDNVRQGGKLSEALSATEALPSMAVRTLRLGEEAGQLPMLAGRVAEFYETKLQRSLDRVVGLVGPIAIIFISLIIGGLIVSVMTALLSVNQIAT
jgi:general secretion pathway protein F